MSDKYMSVNQLAAYLGIGRTLAWKLVWTGKIKSYRVGKLIRIRAVAIEDYLNSVEIPIVRIKSAIRQKAG